MKNKDLDFAKVLENIFTEEFESVDCEYCGESFDRRLGSAYTICSKACLRDIKHESKGY